jgi:dolichyl-phosphate-mannose--protein O-mannosyl transferase
MIVNEGKSKYEVFFCLIDSCRAPIKCDSTIRLLHVATKRSLHSHNFVSPLSHNQEVSAYGENGVGDDGDLWKVVCTSRNDYWLREDGVRLQHVVTGK